MADTEYSLVQTRHSSKGVIVIQKTNKQTNKQQYKCKGKTNQNNKSLETGTSKKYSSEIRYSERVRIYCLIVGVCIQIPSLFVLLKIFLGIHMYILLGWTVIQDVEFIWDKQITMLFLLVIYSRNRFKPVLFFTWMLLVWCWHVDGVETCHWSIISEELKKTWNHHMTIISIPGHLVMWQSNLGHSIIWFHHVNFCCNIMNFTSMQCCIFYRV